MESLRTSKSPVPRGLRATRAVRSRFRLLFSVEKIFERKIFNSVVGGFFPFPDFANDTQSSSLQSPWCLVNYICRVSLQLGSRRKRVRITLSAINFTNFQTLVNTFLFSNKIHLGFLRQHLGVFSKLVLFSKNHSFAT